MIVQCLGLFLCCTNTNTTITRYSLSFKDKTSVIVSLIQTGATYDAIDGHYPYIIKATWKTKSKLSQGIRERTRIIVRGTDFFAGLKIFKPRPNVIRLLVKDNRTLSQYDLASNHSFRAVVAPWGADAEAIYAKNNKARVWYSGLWGDLRKYYNLPKVSDIQDSDITRLEFTWSYAQGKWFPRVIKRWKPSKS